MSYLILASASPRRKELLEKLRIPFSTHSADIDETIEAGQSPAQIVTTLALKKAKAVAEQYRNSVVIGSDTTVVSNGQILGKPVDRQDAKRVLQELSGQTHSVYTGVAVVYGTQLETFYEKTDVTFWPLADEEIERYLDTGEPFDKAGSYGIQDLGALFVQSINGDYFSVVGLPIARLSRVLKKMGFPYIN